MEHPARFIHVGLGKCASTYLQSVWGVDENYVSINSAPIVRALRERAEKSARDIIQIGAPAAQAGKTTILTSEGFSWGWINGTGGREAVRNLRQIAAASFARSNLSGQVFIMVRDPIDWLRALHEQSIKEGGHHSYKVYMGHKKALALATLDLVHLIQVHRDSGHKVVILSADELRQAPTRFWAKYTDALGAPPPSASAISQVEKREFSGNVSLKERLPYLASLNRHSVRLGACFDGLAKYPAIFGAEYESLKPAATKSWIWINRRVAEFAQQSELKALIDSPEDAATFQDVFVSEDMVRHIEERFILPLAAEATIDRALIDRYRQSLEQRRR